MSDAVQRGPVARESLGFFRQHFWPIFSNETKRFLLLVLLLLGALTSYTLLRNMKDGILINAPGSGKDVLAIVKMLFVTPGSVLFVILYSKLSNIFSKEKLFSVVLFGFLSFFALFALVLYPLHEHFNMSFGTIERLQQSTPVLKHFIPAFGYWTYSLFYVVSELWGNVAVSILFWQFANQITPTAQAKRFYPVFSLFSNAGLILAGMLLKQSKGLTTFFFGLKYPGRDAPYELMNPFLVKQTQFLCSAAIFMGLLMYIAYSLIKSSLDKEEKAEKADGKPKAKKPKLGIGESFKILMKSSYLGYITILVLSFNIIINLVELTWKGVVKDYFKSQADYMAFTGNQYIYLGASTFLIILLFQNATRLAGWRLTANIAPVVNLTMGGLFFAFLIYRSLWGDPTDHTLLGIAMYLGLAHNCLGKGTKYAFFDPTKEMAYIPLDEESKVKGKAAIDVIGGRAGKGGGSLINTVVSSFASGTPFFIVIGSIMTTISLTWIWAVNRLAVLYEQKTREKEESKK